MANARQISFEFSTTQTYEIAVTDQNLAVFKDGVFQVDVPTPYTTAELPDISWTQNLDTLLIFHEDHAPLAVMRQGADDEWQVEDWTLNNIPTFDFGLGAEAVISTTRGWPLSGVFFGGRLYLAGLKSRPSTILGTKAGSVNDLDSSSTADDFGINVTALADDVPAFYAVFAGRHLQFFSSSSEYYVPISENTAITPTNFVLRRTSSRGSQKGFRPFSVDGATFFLQRGGKALREFLFVDTEAAYQANNLSLLASHLVRSPTDFTLRRSTSTEDADIVWVINNDGTLAAFTTLRLQDINAWSLVESDGLFKATGVVLADSYFIIERTVQGTSSLRLERFEDDTFTDGHITGGAASGATGLDHLEGESVAIRLDGLVQDEKTVVGGAVTFDRNSTTSFEVGLPFPDVTDDFDLQDEDVNTGFETFVRTMPIEENLPEGSQLGRKKRIVDCTLLVNESAGVIVNGNRVASRMFGAEILDSAIVPVTGQMRVGSILGWTDNGYVKISQDNASPLNILGLNYKLAV